MIQRPTSRRRSAGLQLAMALVAVAGLSGSAAIMGGVVCGFSVCNLGRASIS
jgi:hypothetical protein